MAEVRKISADPTDEQTKEAMEAEAAIAEEAATIRADSTELTPKLFMRLRSLLLKPIPQAFVVATSAGTGKPYASTGVKSVHVQIARMDAVLTPAWWWEEVEYLDDGKLVEVTVYVGSDRSRPMFSRSSRGGVDRASTLGNLHKGSRTNAAKWAFAAVGPGHHIYVGAADLDPDTDEAAAKQQAKTDPGDQVLNEQQNQKVLAAFAAAGLADAKIAEFLKAVGLTTPQGMTLGQAVRLRELLDEHQGVGRPASLEAIEALERGVELAGWDDQKLQMVLVAELGIADAKYPRDALKTLTVERAQQLDQLVTAAIEAAAS